MCGGLFCCGRTSTKSHPVFSGYCIPACINKIKLSLYLSWVPNSIHDSHRLKAYFFTRVWLIIFMTLHFLSSKVYFDPLCTHSLMGISIAKAFKNIYSMQHHQSRISSVHSSEGYPPISWHTALIWPGTSNKQGGGLAAPVHEQSYTYVHYQPYLSQNTVIHL